MPASSNSGHGHPSTHFVQHRSSRDVSTHVPAFDDMITRRMDGPLLEQDDPNRLQSVLDASYGSAGWLIGVARSYPGIARLVGIGMNEPAIQYAHSQIEAAQVTERVEFQRINVQGRLDFSDAEFDLVNFRMGHSYLRTWDWPYLLSELQRITHPGGIVRLTESDVLIESTSPALTQLQTFLMQALYQSGHLFTADTRGINAHLTALLQRAGLKDIKERTHILSFPAGSPETQQLCDNQKSLFPVMLPFFQKWLRLPDDYEIIYQQALTEMRQPDFTAHWRFVTAWGQRPPAESS